MEEKKNNKKVLSIVIVLILLVVIAGVSFAIWNYAFTGNENVISTDEISIEYLESADVIDITNALPMSDIEGKAQEETFDFEVTTRTSAYANISYSLILEELQVEDGYEALTSNQINIGLFDYDNNELVTSNAGSITNSNGVIYSDVNKHDNNTNEIIDKYKLRAWIDSGVDASKWNQNTKLQYKFRINVNASGAYRLDKSGANEPVLTGIENANVQGSSIIPLAEENIQITKSNMIPVYYDEEESTWKKADETNTIEEYKWYDYNNKMWANSVTVTSDSRETYQEASLGTSINMNDILTMQVWIPRYKYKVWNYNLDGNVGSNPQSIEITWEKGEAKTGEITCTDLTSMGTSNGTKNGTQPTTSEVCKYDNTTCTNDICKDKTYTHPGFTFASDELPGFWIGKFEVSSDVTTCTPVDSSAIDTGCNLKEIRPLVKPNITSWRGAMVGTFENNMMAMNDGSNKYGFVTTDDTHMMKNMEWGAVAYLSHSKYGINKEIAINSESTYKTGCGPQEEGSTSSGATCNSYNTTLGQTSSTTGNIYGVYDMSGGAYEYTMGNIVSPNGTTIMSGYRGSSNQYSGYTGIVYYGSSEGDYASYTGGYGNYPEEKYYDKYSFNTSNTTRGRSKLGDAIREVYNSGINGWYSDFSYLADGNDPCFIRGGHYTYGDNSGAFDSNSYNGGYANTNRSSRLVISIPQN